MPESNRQAAGVAVVVRKGDRILVGTRGPACRRGAGLLALPGGVLQHPEAFAACGVREVLEETALEVAVRSFRDAPFSIPGLLAVTDHFDLAQQQSGNLVDHLTFWLMAHWVSGQPQVLEPTKCLGWDWVRPADLFRQLGEASENPTHPQYEWLPAPLLRKVLAPYFGAF